MFSYFQKANNENIVNETEKETVILKKKIDELEHINKELMKKVDHYRQESMIYKDLIVAFSPIEKQQKIGLKDEVFFDWLLSNNIITKK